MVSLSADLARFITLLNKDADGYCHLATTFWYDGGPHWRFSQVSRESDPLGGGRQVRRRYFQDFEIGEVHRSDPYAVSKEEILRFSGEFDPQPFHLDEDAANASVFGGLTASGAHTVALQLKLIHASGAGKDDAVLAALGWDEVRFPKPVSPGDALSLRIECVEARSSETKPDRGVVRDQVTLLNQNDEIVLTSIHTILVAKRAS